MGSSLAPVLANIILTEFERLFVSELIKDGTIKFYKRYVDDTLILIKPCDISSVLDKFNSFDPNLKFTVDTFADDDIHFLDIKISADGIDVYRKNTNTGQYSHFSSFEPFHHKTAWIKSLFHRAFMICSNKEFFEKQIKTIKMFMSWNGYPKSFRNFIINKLLNKSNNNTPNIDSLTDNNVAKIWIRLPYLGNQGDRIINSCTAKIQRFLSIPVKFIVIYDTKRISYFVSNKDKLPSSTKSNVVYEISCPGCGKKYIGMTQRCFSVRLKEHATRISTSAVGKHFSECEHAEYLMSLQDLFCRINDLSSPTKQDTTPLENLVLKNSRILHTSKSNNYNILAFLEALLIKQNKPELNSGLKASKELQLFT